MQHTTACSSCLEVQIGAERPSLQASSAAYTSSPRCPSNAEQSTYAVHPSVVLGPCNGTVSRLYYTSTSGIGSRRIRVVHCTALYTRTSCCCSCARDPWEMAASGEGEVTAEVQAYLDKHRISNLFQVRGEGAREGGSCIERSLHRKLLVIAFQF